MACQQPQRYFNDELGEVVEAMQLTSDNVEEVANWTKGQLVAEIDPVSGKIYAGLNVREYDSPEASVNRVSEGDYVVLLHGVFMPYKPVRFAYTFEQVQ